MPFRKKNKWDKKA